MEFLSAVFDPSLSFLRNSVIVALLSSFSAGIVGSFVVANRMSYIVGSVSHSTIGGVGLSFFLGTVAGIDIVSPSIGGLLFAIISGFVISFFYLWGKERVDTAISLVWIVGMSLGVMFASLTPRFSELTSYLFGSILLISEEDVLYIMVITALVMVIISLFYHQFVLTCFDKDFSKTRGIPPEVFLTVLILLISVTVFSLIKTVGVILSIALITLPSAISNLFANKIARIIPLSVLIASVSQIVGIWISYELDLPAGVVISLLLGTVYTIALTVSKTLCRSK